MIIIPIIPLKTKRGIMGIIIRWRLCCEIYEIKYSTERVPDQYRHLNNEEKCAMTVHRFGDIRGKYVIYRGEAFSDGDIRYMNVEEYLKSLGRQRN